MAAQRQTDSARDELAAKLGREPTEEELAVHLRQLVRRPPPPPPFRPYFPCSHGALGCKQGLQRAAAPRTEDEVRDLLRQQLGRPPNAEEVASAFAALRPSPAVSNAALLRPPLAFLLVCADRAVAQRARTRETDAHQGGVPRDGHAAARARPHGRGGRTGIQALLRPPRGCTTDAARLAGHGAACSLVPSGRPRRSGRSGLTARRVRACTAQLLASAVRLGKTADVKYALTELKASPNAETADGNSALHWGGPARAAAAVG
jgi:hypothetical protein